MLTATARRTKRHLCSSVPCVASSGWTWKATIVADPGSSSHGGLHIKISQLVDQIDPPPDMGNEIEADTKELRDRAQNSGGC